LTESVEIFRDCTDFDESHIMYSGAVSG